MRIVVMLLVALTGCDGYDFVVIPSNRLEECAQQPVPTMPSVAHGGVMRVQPDYVGFASMRPVDPILVSRDPTTVSLTANEIAIDGDVSTWTARGERLGVAELVATDTSNGDEAEAAVRVAEPVLARSCGPDSARDFTDVVEPVFWTQPDRPDVNVATFALFDDAGRRVVDEAAQLAAPWVRGERWDGYVIPDVPGDHIVGVTTGGRQLEFSINVVDTVDEIVANVDEMQDSVCFAALRAGRFVVAHHSLWTLEYGGYATTSAGSTCLYLHGTGAGAVVATGTFGGKSTSVTIQRD